MTDRQLLLHRRFASADLSPELTAALDYLQLRNRDAVRAWRERYAAACRGMNSPRRAPLALRPHDEHRER